MKLQTPVADQECKVGIPYNDSILMLGSCFTDNIGKQLEDFGFDVCINPFGTLYNPISILQSVEMLASEQEFSETDCVEIGAGDGRICSFSHHTSFARTTSEEFIANANSRLEQARAFFRNCNKVIITLGTSWCFKHVANGKVVSNCLKRPSSEFVRERLSVDQVDQALQKIMLLCNNTEGCKQKEFIFTVSPIRHFKDGAHGNQISKASLLLGIEETLQAYVPEQNYQADYFPAYEIMMDELRDYRFYAEDMCHPSAQAVTYLRERFLSWAMPDNEKMQLEENIREFKRMNHRPLPLDSRH